MVVKKDGANVPPWCCLCLFWCLLCSCIAHDIVTRFQTSSCLLFPNKACASTVRQSFPGIARLCYGVLIAPQLAVRGNVCVCVEPRSVRINFTTRSWRTNFQGMEVFFSPRLDDLMAGFEDLANVDDAEGASDDVVWAARTTELINRFEVRSI